MHRLRIQVKKMRYASEFFADVYSGKKAARRGAKFQSALRRLQTCLGDFNDIMTSKARCDTIVKHPARGLSAEQKMQRAFAAGIVTGDQQGRLLELRGRGLKAHSRFSDVKPFWK
jgi:CHAD domain-containing protein